MTDESTNSADATPADAPAAAPAAPEADAAEATPEQPTATPEVATTVEPEPAAAESPEVAAELPDPEPATEDAASEAEDEASVDEAEVAVADDEPAAEAETVDSETDEPDPVAAADEPATPAEPESKKKWYVIKVQSGREDTIKAAIERKVKIEGLEEFFGQIMVPYEEFVEKKSVRAKVKNKKTGEVETVTQEKNVVKKRKKFHGYIFAEVEFNDRILYLFRETSGVGDFVGGGGALKPPTPMPEIEVRKMMGTARPEDKKPIAVKLDYEKGDRVRVKDGAFSGSEAEVKAITMPKDPTDTPKVTVVVTIWGRPVEMEMDYWHVEKL